MNTLRGISICVSVVLIFCVQATAGNLPEPWRNSDVGETSPLIPGDAFWAWDTEVFTVRGSGADLEHEWDGFHFAYQTLRGDCEIVARVRWQAGGHPGQQKAGVMIRNSLAQGSQFMSALMRPAGNQAWYRLGLLEYSQKVDAQGVPHANPLWTKVCRRGNVFDSSISWDGIHWDPVTSQTIPADEVVYVGLAVSANSNDKLSTAEFDHVHVAGIPAHPLPAPWRNSDVGETSPLIPGDAFVDHGVYTVRGSGADLEHEWDGFHFAYQTLRGDCEIVARVLGQAGGQPDQQKAGVMIRNSLAQGSQFMSALRRPAGNQAWYRLGLLEYSQKADAQGVPHANPLWTKVCRRGNVFDSSVSWDGIHWDLVTSQTIPMDEVVYVGLAVSANSNERLSTAEFDHVHVAGVPAHPLPAPWRNSDVGETSPLIPGDAFGGHGVYTVRGSGADLEHEWDGFHFAYQTLRGDCEIVARVRRQGGGHPGQQKAGVMIRNSLAQGSSFMSALMRPAGNQAWYRLGLLEYSQKVDAQGVPHASPLWTKVCRRGNVFDSSVSWDGIHWDLVTSQTIPMHEVVYVGLAVCANSNEKLNTAEFDNVHVAGAPAHSVSTPGHNSDVGETSPLIPGDAFGEHGVYTVRGSGADLEHEWDGFHFVYRLLKGDCEISARVAGQAGGQPDQQQAGVMMRKSLAQGSSFMSTLMRPAGNQARYRLRLLEYSQKADAQAFPPTESLWTKVCRTGDVFESSMSLDGIHWDLVTRQTIRMDDFVYVGLAVSANSNDKLDIAVFDNVTSKLNK